MCEQGLIGILLALHNVISTSEFCLIASFVINRQKHYDKGRKKFTTAENYCCFHLNAQNVTAAEYLASTNERMPRGDICLWERLEDLREIPFPHRRTPQMQLLRDGVGVLNLYNYIVGLKQTGRRRLALNKDSQSVGISSQINRNKYMIGPLDRMTKTTKHSKCNPSN